MRYARVWLEQVIRANSARERLPELIQLRNSFERVLVLLRLAYEVKAFKSFQANHNAAELVVTISRQNEGWIKSVDGVTPRPSSIPRRRESIRKFRTRPTPG